MNLLCVMNLHKSLCIRGQSYKSLSGRNPSFASSYCLQLVENGAGDHVCSCGIEEFICKHHFCFVLICKLHCWDWSTCYISLKLRFDFDLYLQKFHLLIWSVTRDQRIRRPHDLSMSLMFHFLLKVHVSMTYCLDSRTIVICLTAYFLSLLVVVKWKWTVCYAYWKKYCAGLQVTSQLKFKFWWACISFNILMYCYMYILQGFAPKLHPYVDICFIHHSRIW